jgi:protein-disulfide isomerase
MVLVFGAVAAMGATGVILFHNAKKEAQTGTAQTIVRQFYELPKVAWPSVISPFWTARATEKFEDAPIQVVEYVDFLCPDCLYLAQQMDKLKKEFAGKINVAFQYFPLESKCNKVVDKNLHPGACDLSFISAHDPAKFLAIHDEIFVNFRSAKTSEWRQTLARKYEVEAALTDPKTQALVLSIINTGMEYERTSDKAAFGIRSTPTIIINNRMVIGTLPYGHLRAIFQALVDEKEGGRKYLENWVPVPKKTLQTVK